MDNIQTSTVRSQDEAKEPGIYITNYDMLKEFDGGEWQVVKELPVKEKKFDAIQWLKEN